MEIIYNLMNASEADGSNAGWYSSGLRGHACNSSAQDRSRRLAKRSIAKSAIDHEREFDIRTDAYLQ